MAGTTEGMALDGNMAPLHTNWRKLMMWIFIVVDGLMFAGFLASYGFHRLANANWPAQEEIFSLSFIAVMTFILISSSATMASAVLAARNGSPVVTRFIWLTALGGLLFLSMQAIEWSQLIHEGVRLNTNPWGDALFGAYFFLITGFHGSHVLSGVVLLIIVAVRSMKGRATPEGVELVGLYWHFVDLVWIFIFTFFYLI